MAEGLVCFDQVTSGGLEPTHLRVGLRRQMGSFLDEVAHAAGRDPVEFLRALFEDAADLPYGDHGGSVFSPARYLEVLDRVARLGDWGGSVPSGRARGIVDFDTVPFSSIRWGAENDKKGYEQIVPM